MTDEQPNPLHPDALEHIIITEIQTSAVAVVGLTPVPNPWLDHVAKEIERVLDKLQPLTISLFPDSSGCAAACWANAHDIPFTVIRPIPGTDIIATHWDGQPRQGQVKCLKFARSDTPMHSERRPCLEAWAAARSHLLTHHKRFIIIHDQRNRARPIIVRAQRHAEEIITIRPDGGATKRWIPNPNPSKEQGS